MTSELAPILFPAVLPFTPSAASPPPDRSVTPPGGLPGEPPCLPPSLAAAPHAPANASAADLFQALDAFRRQPPPRGLLAALASVDAAVPDFLLTPLSARVGAMGAQLGCLFFHHELRMRVPCPSALLPEVELQEPALPEWQNGILTEARYFSFGQDSQLQCFNPNHRRQWRPHELLHALSRFFWRPDMTRFELYLGARLNELLPVVHWYGWDEAFRPTCPRHLGQPRYELHCPACEAITTPYWALAQQPPELTRNLLDAASRHLQQGLEHWTSEWHTCLQELVSGRQQETPRGPLNASSDAVGYGLGHWNRLTAWSFGRWVEQFLIDGLDYFSSVEGLAGHLLRLHDQLFTAPILLVPAKMRAGQLRRILLDAAHRSCLALEWLGEGSKKLKESEKLLGPVLQEISQLSPLLAQAVDPSSPSLPAPGLLERGLTAWQQWLQTCQGLSKWLPKPVADALPAQGFRSHVLRQLTTEQPSLSPWVAPLLTTLPLLSRRSLQEGLASCSRLEIGPDVPVRGARIPTLPGSGLDAFVDSDTFLLNQPLLQRLARSAEPWQLSPEARLQLAWDAFLNSGLGRDAEGERFTTLPDEAELPKLLQTKAFFESLRANTTLKRGKFPAGWVDKALNLDSREGAQTLLEVVVFSWEGEVRATLLEEAPGQTTGADLLDHWEKRAEKPGEGVTSAGTAGIPVPLVAAQLQRLLEVGALIYLPRPRPLSRA